MQPRDLDLMRKHHPAWRLLTATNATLVISFLYHAFIARNQRQIPESELIPLLHEHLLAAREESGDSSYPLTAKAYLHDWASPDHGYLRVTYDVGSDDPKIDLTTGAERAIEWILTLQKQGTFIGTKSRLLVILDLLRQLRAGTDPNPRLYLTDLERQRRAIDEEIDRIVKGKLHLLPSVEIKDRFSHVVENTRRLLSDLRGVEQNFRTLDLEARKQIASWEAGKGALLGELFKGSDSIQRTEQGQSFLAFWDFLMSRERQDELSELLDAVLNIPDIRLDMPMVADQDIQDFRSLLKACTSNTLIASDDDNYSEQRFEVVAKLLLRLRGRPESLPEDQRWRSRVTDVRNWFEFSAAECMNDTEQIREYFSDSGGKSGGQKEKLAYTVLAASLACQYRTRDDQSGRSFRFVVIDEAFGRGSDESAKYGLTLFRQMGLQLLIATPLQKIQVIEPFVARVGFIENPTGSNSMIRNITIEEHLRNRQNRRGGA